MPTHTAGGNRRSRPEESWACGPPKVMKNASVRHPLSMEPLPFPCHPDLTRISCHASLDMATCAAFVKESRMKFANATNTNRKSGVAEWRDLRFLFPVLDEGN